MCAITGDLNTVSGICNDYSSKAIAAVQQLASGASVCNISALAVLTTQLQNVNRTVTTITLVLRAHGRRTPTVALPARLQGQLGPQVCVADAVLGF